MPTYDYQCSACGGFEARRGVNERDEPIACPDCGAASVRVMSAAPRLAPRADGGRAGVAASQPGRSGDYARLGHASGCGCCGSSGGAGGTGGTGGNGGGKAFPSRRAWMPSR